MDWEAIDKYSIRCGVYWICKVFDAEGAKYAAMYKPKVREMGEHLKVVRNLSAAKRACERHEFDNRLQDAS